MDVRGFGHAEWDSRLANLGVCRSTHRSTAVHALRSSSQELEGFEFTSVSAKALTTPACVCFYLPLLERQRYRWRLTHTYKDGDSREKAGRWVSFNEGKLLVQSDERKPLFFVK